MRADRLDQTKGLAGWISDQPWSVRAPIELRLRE